MRQDAEEEEQSMARVSVLQAILWIETAVAVHETRRLTAIQAKVHIREDLSLFLGCGMSCTDSAETYMYTVQTYAHIASSVASAGLSKVN